ncbi:DNA-directed RNA polymerase subunit omega [Clostridium cochlearium]|jgi:DNA-directed RNA polymerase subunit omega|uniref:DNA-directed RNA polymerase subunit omega n=1 Tax=Clostridium cochlearium TaxID=1494 RepID=A0A239ZWU1_CLOCO|nr:DNA-directed RNA polymerase subunit omega [Clostridium cochlearium]MBV1818059.1 DNA-directed RNA polymerase subunit omega [Bacteroidales bacterium MSK.15.36]NSJ90019.1 DNA-directed RNA polymerase subunit omega [Coprococcus sp. MSK.21.13]MBE6064263.1 DNA-directed RNA polymerase subunit omega [Clostridium cochlearium]MBU5268708.1 DNA-directed RNA polymerase subunit omega [Clostridium cochlearium]MCG4572261.1 DNA-directed RNA polymerase subunit omega [Clostridium cochlearium]
MNNSMINPAITDLLKKVDNRYSLVVVTSKRARQLVDGDDPLLESDIVKPVSLAIEEVNEGLISYETIKEGIK